MARSRVRRILLVIVVTVALMSLTGCGFLLTASGPSPITVVGDLLSLSWDADQTSIPDTPSATAYFDLYYRRLGTLSWTHIHQTPDFRTAATILRGSLPPGNYEFAVQAVYHNGRTSELHTSTDFTAWPPGGWYVQWMAD